MELPLWRADTELDAIFGVEYIQVYVAEETMGIGMEMFAREMLDNNQGEQTASMLISQALVLLSYHGLFDICYWLTMGTLIIRAF